MATHRWRTHNEVDQRYGWCACGWPKVRQRSDGSLTPNKGTPEEWKAHMRRVEERERRYRAKADRIIAEDFSTTERQAQTGTP